MRTILEVSVENFLSFRKATVPLQSLNVLVGPNGAGKTNFLRIFQFLGEVARQDLTPAIDFLGGFSQVRFRGEIGQDRTVKISLSGVITEHASLNAPDEYSLSFWERPIRMRQRDPSGRPIENEQVERRLVNRNENIVLKRFKGRGRRITLSGKSIQIAPDATSGRKSGERTVSVQAQSSGLNTLRKLGNEYGAEQVEALAQVFENLRLVDVAVDDIRRPGRTSNPSRLEATGGNVASYLQWLSEEHPPVFQRLCEDICFVLPSFESFQFTKIGGSDEYIRLDIKERHLSGYTPLARASFGTIRSIALFAMLHDPSPPKLTCLEEVDHGFHPHALDRLVERLREASSRTQVIVATHSPALVNKVSPEELIIFERDPATNATRVGDLSPAQIHQMAAASDLRLGELWFSGTLGGGRE